MSALLIAFELVPACGICAETISVYRPSGVALNLIIADRHKLEASYGSGTREYLVDQFEIDEDAKSLTTFVDTKFRRDGAGKLHIFDLATGTEYFEHFGRAASIKRVVGSFTMFVKPGETMSPDLKRLIALGGARYRKTL